MREDIGPDTWKPAGRTDDFSTAMPAGICLAATWNPELGFNEGEAIGQEARARGKDIMLGPGREHPAHAALRTEFRIPRRRPVPLRRECASATSAASNRRTFPRA